MTTRRGNPASAQPLEALMFSRSASFVKSSKEWSFVNRRRSVESNAKAFAKLNMVAVVMLPNDDAVMYLYDVANDRIAKKVCRKPEWVA